MILLRFLYDANLIGKYTPPTTKGDQPIIINPIIDLTDADFYGVTLSTGNTNNMVSLNGAVLSGASLVGVDLSHANLSKALLGGADLSGATLTETNFSHADLSGATLTGAKGFDASGVHELSGATMPDGTIVAKTMDKYRMSLLSMFLL